MLYNILKLKTIPDVVFAHIHHSTNYKAHFSPMEPNLEIAYIKTGALKLIFDGQEIIAPEESFLILPHKYEFSIESIESGQHIHYTVSALVDSDSVVVDTPPMAINENTFCIPLCIKYSHKTEGMLHLLNSIIKEHQNADAISKYKCGAKLIEFLCEASLTTQTEEASQFGKSALILDRRIKKYIEKSIRQKITLADIAICLGKNPNYLNQVFQRINNTSIISYVNLMKMKYAAKLIEETGLSLKEIAGEVGIGDVSYLSRLFKAKMGMTISEFRTNSVYKTFSLNDKERIYKNRSDK